MSRDTKSQIENRIEDLDTDDEPDSLAELILEQSQAEEGDEQ